MFPLLLLFVVARVNAETCGSPAVAQDIGALLNYPIHDLESTEIQALISQSVAQLDTNHYFHIPNFLTSQAVSLLAGEFLSNRTVKAVSARKNKTIFQDKGDFDQFPDPHHPRNIKLSASVIFIGRTDLTSACSTVVDLYSYPPLLQFFKAILTNLTVSPYADLHLSKDPEGSVYGLIIESNEWASWHLDEHPFSCVWTLQQPLYGSGAFAMVHLPPSADGSWPDYGVVGDIIRNDSVAWKQHVRYHMVNEGEVYCFHGNVSMHAVMPIVGNMDRVNFVTTFSEIADFSHKDSVNEFNTWGQHNPEVVKHKEL